MKKIFFLILIMSFYSHDSFAQLSKETEQKIDRLFSEFDETSPGYSIGIVINNQLVFSKGYGMANFESNQPNNSETAFNLASVSKQFTGACLALLILDGKIDLDDPVSKFIPEIEKYEEEILVKHLIYNTSGLTDYYHLPRKNGLPWSPFHYFTIDEAIETSLTENELGFTPGSEWAYVNVNFMLIAKIIEEISGLSLSEFADQKLFSKLKMNQTIVHSDITQIIPNKALGYNYRTNENVAGYLRYGIKVSSKGNLIQQHRNSPHYGGSGVYSSVNDLALWSIDLIQKKTFPKEFYEIMLNTPSFDHDRNNQAFGLYFSNYKDRKKISWDGGDWGFSTELAHFPDQKISIICLSNIGSGRSFEKVNQIADLLIEANKL